MNQLIFYMENENTANFLGGTVFFAKGELMISSEIQIDGGFYGNIYSLSKLVIGASSDIKGNVMTDSCEIFGQFKGNAYAKGTIVLHKGCSVTGGVFATNIVMEEGSWFSGRSSIITAADFDKTAKSKKMYKCLLEKSRKASVAKPAEKK